MTQGPHDPDRSTQYDTKDVGAGASGPAGEGGYTDRDVADLADEPGRPQREGDYVDKDGPVDDVQTGTGSYASKDVPG